ncbi:hypothetical protein DICSQDRAFT_179688 [Dichomitus squalens LYAD-421 SS1]|uniref:uncharacterized protein n=1 Tax=Dichomitus squalens (strain LYAD-421) TaxID=732165 RepID=UPI00044160D3|nr:uncharacterized protein DICSQDRAFT_179688 [Dichomitus squalens LYAD-421 SS1]EJF63029.1 hypothetical protein DICSQDRAFT_179688 [Dichomitus squalens LYAD-421 SS1]
MSNTHKQSLASDSTSTRALNQKSPRPAFINLDECKPIISTTTANTSRNSSTHGTTAFVFTSSRILRALQDQDETCHHQWYPSSPSGASVPASPYTSSAASSPSRTQRASLTLSQLVKHSEGAVDARSLLGPKMRAAGFVNMSNSHFRRANASCPSSPLSASHDNLVSAYYALPTPRDPPDFPPMRFVENKLDWYPNKPDVEKMGSTSLASSGPGLSEYTPGPHNTSASLSTSAYSARRPPLRNHLSDPGSGSSGPFSSSSSSTLVSASVPLTAVEEAEEISAWRSSSSPGSSSSRRKGRARRRRDEPVEYPFPATCGFPRSQRSPGFCGSRASSATASPTIIAPIPPAAQPASQAGSLRSSPPVSSSNRLAASSAASSTVVSSSSSYSSHMQSPTHDDPSSSRRRRSSIEKRAKAKAKGRDKATATDVTEQTPSFSTAKRLGYHRPYSLTELCDSSPFAWLGKSDMFAPPAPISRSLVKPVSPALVPFSSRPPAVVDPQPPQQTRHHRHHTTAHGGNAKNPEGRVHRIASEPLGVPSGPSGAPGSASEHDVEKGHQSKRTAKAVEYTVATTDNDCGHLARGVLPTADVHGDKPGDVVPVKGRGRDTRGKTLGASESTEDRAAAQEHAEMDKEKMRALEALTQLSIRDGGEADFARHIAADRARDKTLKEKQRAHHKFRGKTIDEEYDPSESEITMVEH